MSCFLDFQNHQISSDVIAQRPEAASENIDKQKKERMKISDSVSVMASR